MLNQPDKKDGIIANQCVEITGLRNENALLRQKIDLLIRQIFGSKSERLDPAQLELLLEGFASEDESKKDEASPDPLELEEAVPASCKAPSPRSGRNNPRWPADLPVEETIIEPELVLAAPQDWRLIGSEVNEQLDYQPAKFICRRIIRRKYVHRRDLDQAPILAPLPEGLQERCVAAPGLLAQVLVAKYCDHLPLYRQEQPKRSEMDNPSYFPSNIVKFTGGGTTSGYPGKVWPDGWDWRRIG